MPCSSLNQVSEDAKENKREKFLCLFFFFWSASAFNFCSLLVFNFVLFSCYHKNEIKLVWCEIVHSLFRLIDWFSMDFAAIFSSSRLIFSWKYEMKMKRSAQFPDGFRGTEWYSTSLQSWIHFADDFIAVTQ